MSIERDPHNVNQSVEVEGAALRRTYRNSPIHQFVLALGPVVVPDRYTDLDPDRLLCHGTVVRLDDLEPATLLSHPTTAALAALGHGTTAERTHALTTAAELIATLPDPDRGEILLEAAMTLASIVLSRRIAPPGGSRAHPGPRYSHRPPLAGRRSGRRPARRVVQLATAMLRRRFGDDPGIAAAAEHLADLPDEEWLALIEDAGAITDLAP